MADAPAPTASDAPAAAPAAAAAAAAPAADALAEPAAAAAAAAAAPAPAPTPVTYMGGCHCGKVRWEFTAEAPITSATVCNCSICSKTGAVMTFVPDAAFKLTAGESAMTDYLFNKRTIHHLFCDTCGIRSFARGASPTGVTLMINLRCVDGMDIDKLTLTHYDGKSL